MFIDEIEIKVTAGKGGDGCTSFRREKFAPKGGPDGGTGGRGGDVVMRANENYNTLFHLTHIPRFHAGDGGKGGAKNCSGKHGRDLVIDVPPGTIIFDAEKNVVLKDLKKNGEKVIIALGSKGGRGNRSFASPTNQTPYTAEKGEPGEERLLKLELKLIADVGIIGLPNAGKSTLLSKISSARPKIADYPFTTLTPYLGIVNGGEFRTCVVADLPGLIEGAHKGQGLGDKFLRHIERTKIVLHLVDVSSAALKPPAEAYKVIRNELASYSKSLAEKKEILVANKVDLLKDKNVLKGLKKVSKRSPVEISALKSKGLKELINTIFKTLA